MEKKRKYLYLEAMRIIACFFVIFNHTRDDGFFLFSQEELGSRRFWCYMFVSIFCKFSVPLFLAISGALLIPQINEPLSRLWKKRIFKIVAILVGFSFVYYMKEVYVGNQVFSLKNFLLQLYDSNWNTSYWYLYAYLAFMMSLPFLRTLAYNLDNKYYFYMFGLVIFFKGILPIMEYILWEGNWSLNSQLRVGWLGTTIVFYPLIGYFLQHRIKDIEKWGNNIWAMWVFNIISILMCCYVTYLKAKITGECSESKSQGFHESFVMINTVTIYLTIKYLFVKYQDKIPKWLDKMICSVGGCTFGIYLWHIMILKSSVIGEIWDFLRTDLGINDMITAFMVCFITMFICYGITWGIKKLINTLAGMRINDLTGNCSV